MATGPAYMNSITSHSKVKTTITLSAPLFVAGQDITGKMELECKAEREVGIGLIMIELLGIQELNSRDHTTATTFVHSHRIFQGPGLPPSNAVHDHTTPQDPTFPPDYFPARKGITTFFFKFPTPISSPSSVSFASDLAKIEYKIRANVGIAYKGDIRLLTNSVNAELVQCQDMEGAVDEHVVVGEGGKVYVRGKLIGGRAVTGEKACLELHVKNQTSKKTTGLNLTLTRSLHLHGAGSSVPVQLTDTLLSESFRSAEYCVPPNTEGIANLVFTVPSSTRVVKGGTREGNVDRNGAQKQTDPLFELRCYLSVKIGMGLGSKDILFEMPIQVKHRATAGQEATYDRNPYLSPVSPEPIFNRAISPLPSHSPRALSPMLNPHSNSMSPVSYTNQPLTSPAPIYMSPKQTIHPPVLNPGDPNYARAVSPRLWSPVSPVPTAPYPSQSPLPAYYFPPPPVQLLPFAFPARPNSADPHYYPYYQNQANLPSGLPPISSTTPFSSPYSPYSPFQPPFQNQIRPPLPPVPIIPQHPPFAQTSSPSQPPPPSSQAQPASQPEIPSTSSQLQHQEADSQPIEGKGERASRIAHRLHASHRARSVSPTSHRFQAPSVSTIKQPPPPVTGLPYATTSRHLPVLSPRPVISPSQTYVGHSPRSIGNGTTKSDRVDLLEQMVDVAPGDEEKSVEEVLRDIEEAEKAGQDKKGTVNSESLRLPVPSNETQSKKRQSLLDVFNLQVEESKNNNAPIYPLPQSHKYSSRPIEIWKPDIRNDGLDALERRLLQEVGTRKPEAIRPTVFDLGLVDKSITQTQSEQLAATQEKDESRPPSPCTVRLHPRQFRESQISELALGFDGEGDRNIMNRRSPSPVSQTRKQSQEQESSVRKAEPKQFKKDTDLRDHAKGRVSEWLGGLPSFSPSMTRADTAPVVHLAEPKKAPPRKRSIDGVLEFLGIGKSKSTENMRATSPADHRLSAHLEQSDIPKKALKPNDKLTIPSQPASAHPVSPQRRTPSPSRKPAPRYVESPTEIAPVQPQVDSDRNALLDDLSDSHTSLKPPINVETSQTNGAAVETERTFVTPSKKTSLHQRTDVASKVRTFQPDPEIKEARLPIKPVKPVKPDALRGNSPSKPTAKPIFTPTGSNHLKSLPAKPSKPAPPTNPYTGELKMDGKVKDALPPIPVSALKQLSPPVSDPQSKYDVRSARGGRGGITASVAAIWASRAEANSKEGSLIPASKSPPDFTAQKTLVPRPGGKAIPASITSVTPKVIPDPARPESLEEGLERPSRDPIKATSVPAQVDRYHAIPQLSSAATLSQPALDVKYKPPSLSMTLSTVFESSTNDSGSSKSSAKAGEIPFGQARLKDLIKKYQQEAT